MSRTHIPQWRLLLAAIGEPYGMKGAVHTNSLPYGMKGAEHTNSLPYGMKGVVHTNSFYGKGFYSIGGGLRHIQRWSMTYMGLNCTNFSRNAA